MVRLHVRTSELLAGTAMRWPLRIGIFVCYCVLAIALTWPLATSAGSHVPLGTEKVASVPALNVWTVWWNADRAKYAFSDYWHAPIFAPARYALAFSEAQPTSLVVAPLVYVAGPAAAYNVYLLAVLTLNGLASFRLLKRLGFALIPALLGGALIETLPMVHWQLGVLQLTTICGVVWVLDRLVALRDASTIRNAFLLGVATFLCYAACNYFGLFLSVLLPLAFLPLVWGRWLDWRFWSLAAAAAVVAGMLSLPILWAQFEAKREYEWHREEALLVSLSAKPRDYLTTPWTPLTQGPNYSDADRPLWMLGGGPFKILLAAVGIAAGFGMRGRRRWTLFLVLFGAAAFGLSLGPATEIRGWSPYKSLMALHPGLALARSPFRFAFFVQLAVALLATNMIDGLWRATLALGRKFQGRERMQGHVVPNSSPNSLMKGPPLRIAVMVVGILLTIATGVYAAAEVWPARQNLFEMPATDRPWINWLRNNSDPSSPIVCLPFPPGATVEDYERTSIFMLEQVGHRRAMVGGYSGFFPPDFLRLKAHMETFPDQSVLNELRVLGVTYIVIADPVLFGLADRSPSLGLVLRDGDAKVRIYKLLPPPIDYERFFNP